MTKRTNIKKQVLFYSILFVSFINAQSIDDGINFYYDQKYESAKNAFTKNSNSDEGIYWLGQVMFMQKATNDEIRKLYQDGLTTYPKSDLLKIGLSQIDIVEGKLGEAKIIQNNILKGSKDPDIYNAVARAHILNGEKGDPNFVVDKLRPIYDKKRNKNFYIPIHIAQAYLLKKNTSEATYAYIAANKLDSSSPLPLYQRGKMYNPGADPENETKYLNYINQALAKDPKFLPALYELFYFNFKKGNKAKAMDYFNKYKEYADKDKNYEYIVANVYYNNGEYANAISESNKIIARDGENADPKFYKVLAFSYIDSGDLLKGRENLNQYLSKINKDEINYGDYLEIAKISKKLGDETTQSQMLQEALNLSKEKGEKYNIAKEAISMYKEKVDSLETEKANEDSIIKPYRKELANWHEIHYYNHHKPTNVDLYNFGLQNFLLENWTKVNEAFSLYITKYPTQVEGYYFIAVANSENGLNNETIAEENFNKVVEIGMTNPTANSFYLTNSLLQLAQYDLKRNDIPKSKERAQQILSYDPTNERALVLMK